ncbi:MAG: hypothetical protein WC613_02965 [Candidatus Aenigmatarchaeota archaeon]
MADTSTTDFVKYPWEGRIDSCNSLTRKQYEEMIGIDDPSAPEYSFRRERSNALIVLHRMRLDIHERLP